MIRASKGHEVSAAGHQVTLVALGALDDNGGLTLLIGCFRNHEAGQACHFIHFLVQGDAFLQNLELDRAFNFRQDGKGVRISLDQYLPELHLGSVFDLELGAVDHLVTLLLTAAFARAKTRESLPNGRLMIERL